MSNHDFFTRFARILNAGQSRSVVLCGNIYDLFYNGTEYVPLIPLLCKKSKTSGIIQLVYELNGPIRIADDRDRKELRGAWISWKAGIDYESLVIQDMTKKQSEAKRLEDQFERHLRDAIGNPTLALEFLRQLTICSRSHLRPDLLIIIEAADMLLPAGSGDVAQLGDKQLRRISIVQDWFGDPAFIHGNDSVCLIAESRHLIHSRIARMPQVLSVEVPAPGLEAREHYIETFCAAAPSKLEMWSTPRKLAEFTAGLSIHAIRQLLAGAAYTNEKLVPASVITKVEDFVQAQLGEDVVEFKKPSHRLDDVVG
ncbi:MAG TPA: hypothetical protein VE890_05055, partial [Thermoguttaceae bacterium]|nr:hypothetical protein [Thermoguttaceae bacterium]